MVTLAVGVGAWLWWRDGGERPHPVPGERDRVTVEVLNATGVDGLAREMSRRLRHQGVDVVYFGTARMETLTVTRIVVRRGDSSGAYRVRDALGAGTIVADYDPRLLLDVSVLLGRDLATALDRNP